jgi:hypothetical protein
MRTRLRRSLDSVALSKETKELNHKRSEIIRTMKQLNLKAKALKKMPVEKRVDELTTTLSSLISLLLSLEELKPTADR